LDEQGEWIAEHQFDKSSRDNEVMYAARNALKIKRVFFHDGSGKETSMVLTMSTVKDAINELTGLGSWSTSSGVQERVGEVCSFLTRCVQYGNEHGLDTLHFKFM
jgi:hypothetical protein